MNWNEIKNKILIFGEDDYIFADMFISIVGEIDSEKNNLIKNTFLMLKELIDDKLVEIYILNIKNNEIKDLIKYEIKCEEDVSKLIHIIDSEWQKINYQFPKPNQLFWATTTEKGCDLIF